MHKLTKPVVILFKLLILCIYTHTHTVYSQQQINNVKYFYYLINYFLFEYTMKCIPDQS